MSGDVNYVHEALFTDLDAVSACAQQLTSRYVVPGLARLSIDPQPFDGGFMLRLRPMPGRDPVPADPVKLLVEEQGHS